MNTPPIIIAYSVDDDKDASSDVKEVVNELDIECVLINKHSDYLDFHLTNKPHILILDHLFPGGITGLQILEKAREVNPFVFTIVFTAYGSMTLMQEYQRAGANDFINKSDADYYQQLKDSIRVGVGQAKAWIKFYNVIKKEAAKYDTAA